MHIMYLIYIKFYIVLSWIDNISLQAQEQNNSIIIDRYRDLICPVLDCEERYPNSSYIVVRLYRLSVSLRVSTAAVPVLSLSLLCFNYAAENFNLLESKFWKS